MTTTLFTRATRAAIATLCVLWPVAASAQGVIEEAQAANLAHASAANRCDKVEMSTQLLKISRLFRRGYIFRSSWGIPFKEEEAIQRILEEARARQPFGCPPPADDGFRIGLGAVYGEYNLSDVGFGYLGDPQNAFASQSADTISISGFDGWAESEASGMHLEFGYRSGRTSNDFKYSVSTQVKYGGLYTGLSPSGSTSVPLEEKGLDGANRVELRSFYAGGEIPIFSAERHVFTFFNFDRVEIEHIGTISAEATFFGNNFFFDQRRVQNVDENRFGAGIGRRFVFPLGPRFTFKSTAGAGAYYRRGSLGSVERVTGNVMPQQDRDFTIQIRDTDNGVGFMGKLGATLDVPLSSQISLSGEGSLRYLSHVSAIDNPGSSRAITEGATTRIGTDRAMLGQFGLNLVYRIGRK